MQGMVSLMFGGIKSTSDGRFKLKLNREATWDPNPHEFPFDGRNLFYLLWLLTNSGLLEVTWSLSIDLVSWYKDRQPSFLSFVLKRGIYSHHEACVTFYRTRKIPHIQLYLYNYKVVVNRYLAMSSKSRCWHVAEELTAAEKVASELCRLELMLSSVKDLVEKIWRFSHVWKVFLNDWNKHY